MESKTFKDKAINFALSNGILVAILILIIVTGCMEKNFFQWQNVLNILRQISVNGIIACGMTVCIMSGCYDLSVGSTVSMVGVFVILLVNGGYSDFICIAVGIGCGLIAGLLNGGLIAAINGRSGEAFIITYGMQVALGAVALFPSNGLFLAGRVHPGPFVSMGEGNNPIFIFAIVAIILYILIERTSFGRTLCYMGSNLDAARMSGVRVRLNRVIYFVISGLCAGLGGVILCSRVTSASPTAGLNYEMNAIAAVVVGGNSASGGSGSIIRTVIGTIVIGVMGNALNIIGMSTNYQLIIKGILVIIAVALDIISKNLKR